MREYLDKFYWLFLENLIHGRFGKTWHFVISILKHLVLQSPHTAIIETANVCNLRCPTCPTPHRKIYQKRPPGMMTLKNFKKIIDNIKNYVHIVYLYNTNEPLLCPLLPEMIRYANLQNLYTKICTNALLLDKQKAEEILNSGLDEILLALDGLTKESYEGFRVGSNFEKVKENIENICQRKRELKLNRPKITLQFILNKLNQNQVEDIKKYAKKIKADRLYIKSFILSEYAYSKDEIKILAEKFFPTKGKYEHKIVYKKKDQDLVPKKVKKYCSAPNSVFGVLYDGRLTMCCFDLYGEYIWGDLTKQNLKEIWFNSEIIKKRKIASRRGYPLCKVCANIE